eukprot:122347_1
MATQSIIKQFALFRLDLATGYIKENYSFAFPIPLIKKITEFAEKCPTERYSKLHLGCIGGHEWVNKIVPQISDHFEQHSLEFKLKWDALSFEKTGYLNMDGLTKSLVFSVDCQGHKQMWKGTVYIRYLNLQMTAQEQFCIWYTIKSANEYYEDREGFMKRRLFKMEIFKKCDACRSDHTMAQRSIHSTPDFQVGRYICLFQAWPACHKKYFRQILQNLCANKAEIQNVLSVYTQDICMARFYDTLTPITAVNYLYSNLDISHDTSDNIYNYIAKKYNIHGCHW